MSFNSFHIKKIFSCKWSWKRELIITNLLLFDQFSDWLSYMCVCEEECGVVQVGSHSLDLYSKKICCVIEVCFLWSCTCACFMFYVCVIKVFLHIIDCLYFLHHFYHYIFMCEFWWEGEYMANVEILLNIINLHNCVNVKLVCKCAINE